MRVPTDPKKLDKFVQNLTTDCRVSCTDRATAARVLRQWKLTGSNDGNAAIYNRLETHIGRKAAYLFSPVDLRFQLEFENHYTSEILQKSEVAALYLTKQVEKQNLDILFAQSVEESLTYGSSIVKLMWGHDGLVGKLVPPWTMGVYREDATTFDAQEAVVETSYITLFDFWRRISHLPDAKELFKRAKDHAKKAGTDPAQNTFFHDVTLSGQSPIVDTTATGGTTGTGGVVGVESSNLGPSMSANVIGNLVTFHEMTVLDDELGDYTTIQWVEPDIIITPRIKKYNLFLEKQMPYVLVQPNTQAGYFWGRSELVPLLKLQALLRDRLEDIKKIMGLQYDRLLAFIGFSGMGDETYDQFRQAGFLSEDNPGAKVEDLTPKMPEDAFADVKEILGFLDDVSGFQNILGGQGESGVRSGNHAQTLLKTASPRMRASATLVERQCADMGNLAFELLRVKEAKAHWIGTGEDDSKEFLLAQIPDDYRVVVDSHSGSPIYEDDHKQMAAFLLKAGIIDGESALDLLQIPMRDLLKARFKKAQEEKAKLVQQHPELLTKGTRKR